MIARILKAVLSKESFCWVSRGTIQLQSMLQPIKWSYWSKLDEKLYLGAMPLKNWGHLDEITQLGVKAILSINCEYEFQPQLGADPVRGDDWMGRNINFMNISSPDLEPIEVLEIARAVDFVAQQIRSGNPVYVHCTGGRGRSVSVAICSLAKVKNCTLSAAIQHVKSCRPQAMLNQSQMDNIVSWYELQPSSSEASACIDVLPAITRETGNAPEQTTGGVLSRAFKVISEYREPNANRYSRGEGFWSHPSEEQNTNFFTKLTYPRSQRENWYAVTPYIAEFWCTVSNAGLIYVGVQQNSPALLFAGVASAVSHSIPKQWLLTLDKVGVIAVTLTFAKEYKVIAKHPFLLAPAALAGVINLSDSYLSRFEGRTFPHVLWHLSSACLASVVLQYSESL